MKKLYALLILTVSFSIADGQGLIDALFRKYAEKDGYTVFTVSGNILNNLSLNYGKEYENSTLWDIDEIRILTEEDNSTTDVNFYDAVIKDISMADYEEYMRINGSGQNMVMLVKTAGKRIKEFLLVSGGEDNVLIQIKGDISVTQAEELASNMRKNRTGRQSVITN